MGKESKVTLRFTAVDKLSGALRNITKKFQPMTDAARRANNVFRKLQDTTERFRKGLGKAGTKMREVGKTLTSRVSLPIAGAGALMFRTAFNFEKAMNEVEAKAKDGGVAFSQLRDRAKDLGATTQFTAAQAAQGMVFLAQAGFDTKEIFESITPTLNLAAASNIELAEAADIASNISGAFKIKAKDLNKVVDVLALTTARSNVDMIQLSESMKFAAPIAQKYGMSIEDTAAAVGLLGNVGIQGTLAGTGLRRMMLALSAPTKQVKQLFERMNVQTKDAAGNLRPVSEVLREFGDGLKKLPQANRLAAIEAVFGKIGVTAAAEIIDQATSGKLQDFTKELQAAGGAADKMAQTMNKGIVGETRNLVSAFEAMLIAVAESGVLQAMGEFFRWVTQILRGLKETNPALLKWGAIILGIGAVLGPVLSMIGFMASGITALIPVVTGLISVLSFLLLVLKGVFLLMVANPIGLIITGVGLLIAMVVRAISIWDRFTASIKRGYEQFGILGALLQGGKTFFGLDDSSQAMQPKGNPRAGRIMEENANGKTNTNNAAVSVDFKNLPRGSKVSSTPGQGPLDLSLGFQGAVH